MLQVAWATVTGATGYNVYRRTSAGSYNFASPLNGGTPERIRLEFLRRVREERKFESPEALKAQKEGKVRFIGYTGHKSPHIHLKMLDKHKWDTVQMPINVLDYHYRSFARQMVPEAAQRGVGVIGMKSLGGGAQHKGRLIAEKICTVEEALNYSLSQPIATLVVGINMLADGIRQATVS